jgi:hypothetical protein
MGPQIKEQATLPLLENISRGSRRDVESMSKRETRTTRRWTKKSVEKARARDKRSLSHCGYESSKVIQEPQELKLEGIVA